jgi:hypothetical protein
MNHEDIMLSGRSQRQKDKYCICSLLQKGPRAVKCLKAESTVVVSREWGGGGQARMASYCLMGMEFLYEKIKKSGDGWMVVTVEQ